MSRLSHIRGHEVAIQTILDELQSLELHISSGKQFSSQDIKDLDDCLRRLGHLVKMTASENAQRWKADKEPHPHWLRPKPKAGEGPEEKVAKEA